MDVQILSSSSSTTSTNFLAIKQEPSSGMEHDTSSDEDQKPNVKHDRPAYTIVKLVLQALKSSPDFKMTSSEIIAFIQQHYGYYRNKYNCPSWQSQVHQVLRSKDFFKKILREEGDNGRGCYWQLDGDCKEILDCAYELGRSRLRNHLKDIKPNIAELHGTNVKNESASTSEDVQELEDISVGPPPAKLQKKAAKPRKSTASKPVSKQPTVGVRRGRGTYQRKRSATPQYDVQDSSLNISNEEDEVMADVPIVDVEDENSNSASNENNAALSGGIRYDMELLWKFAIQNACHNEMLCRKAFDLVVTNMYNTNNNGNNPENNSQIPLDLTFGVGGINFNCPAFHYIAIFRQRCEAMRLKIAELERYAAAGEKQGMIQIMGQMAIDSQLFCANLVEAVKSIVAV